MTPATPLWTRLQMPTTTRSTTLLTIVPRTHRETARRTSSGRPKFGRSSGDDPSLEDGEELLDLVEPGAMFRGEVNRPVRVVFEPVEDIVGVVSRLVVTDEVSLAARVSGGDALEEFDEDLAAGGFGEKAEGSSEACVERPHEGQCPVTYVLKLALDGSPRFHRYVGVAALQRLHAGFLIDADDVLVCRGVVIE